MSYRTCVYFGNSAPLLGVLVVAAHQEDGHDPAAVAGAVPGAQDHQVGRVRHRALVQVILLHLQPMPLSRLVNRFDVLQNKT